MIEYLGDYREYSFAINFDTLMGFRCGYVFIPQGHPCFEKNYEDINIRCHGGLTYSDHYFNGTYLDDWIIEFDCNHCMDGIDMNTLTQFPNVDLEMIKKMPGFETKINNKFMTQDDCINECKSIINQLIKIEEQT